MLPAQKHELLFTTFMGTISQLNQTIRVQTEMIKDLRKTIEEHHASDEKKDQIISNLQAEISYLKAKLFGASSEKRRKEDLPGQMSLFDELMEEEPAKEIEPEYIEIKAHKRKRKKKSRTGSTITPKFLMEGRLNQELMRLAYVAMTRPKRLLMLAMPDTKDVKECGRFPEELWTYEKI